MDEATQCLYDGIIATEYDAGATIEWNGATYACAGGPELGGKLLGAGGFRVTADVTIVILLDQFAGGAGPLEKQRLDFISCPGATPRPLRVDGRTLFRNALVILECNAPNRAA